MPHEIFTRNYCLPIFNFYPFKPAIKIRLTLRALRWRKTGACPQVYARQRVRGCRDNTSGPWNLFFAAAADRACVMIEIHPRHNKVFTSILFRAATAREHGALLNIKGWRVPYPCIFPPDRDYSPSRFFLSRCRGWDAAANMLAFVDALNNHAVM